MSADLAGFREIEHTADWEIQVWAPDLNMLFEHAARGMYALCGARMSHNQPQKRTIDLEAADPEALLIGFLSELLYYYDLERIGFERFNLEVTGNHLQGEIQGSAITSIDKEIKAVTFHNLKIRQSKHGLEVNLVFDV